MAPKGDALAGVVALGVGSRVCVCAAAARDDQGTGVGSLSHFARQVVAVGREGCGVAAVRTRLAWARALCRMSAIGDEAAVVRAACCGEEEVEACARSNHFVAKYGA